MPRFNARIIPKPLMHLLLPFRPPHPHRLRVSFDANHLIRRRQLRINSGSKRMDQFGPTPIPDPEHSTAITTETPLRRYPFFLGCSAVFDCGVFPSVTVNITVELYIYIYIQVQMDVRSCGRTYLINSFPLVTFSESDIPPRFTLPLYPPTLRQMLQAQS